MQEMDNVRVTVEKVTGIKKSGGAGVRRRCGLQRRGAAGGAGGDPAGTDFLFRPGEDPEGFGPGVGPVCVDRGQPLGVGAAGPYGGRAGRTGRRRCSGQP